jgi:NDP-sugar pyrophosphorylase family protein
MQAVVMAAGEGRRLRPLTGRFAKPVLPIDGRPVIATLLHELATAGVSPITVVTGHLAEQVEALLDGLRLRFVRQPEPLGSADAVRRAALGPPYLVLGADTVFSPGDVGRFLEAACGADGAIAVRRDPPPSPTHRSAVRVDNGRVMRVLDRDPENPLAGAPLWFVGDAVAPHLAGLPGPPYELAEAFQRAIDAGAHVAGVEISRTRDLTFPLDLVVQNFPYLTGLSGMRVDEDAV